MPCKSTKKSVNRKLECEFFLESGQREQELLVAVLHQGNAVADEAGQQRDDLGAGQMAAVGDGVEREPLARRQCRQEPPLVVAIGERGPAL